MREQQPLMASINEDFMINIRLEEAIATLHRIYLNVSAPPHL